MPCDEIKGDAFAGLRDQIINYRGYAATRDQAYHHAFRMTGNLLSAERMAYGFSVPVLTAEQVRRYRPFAFSEASAAP